MRRLHNIIILTIVVTEIVNNKEAVLRQYLEVREDGFGVKLRVIHANAVVFRHVAVQADGSLQVSIDP